MQEKISVLGLGYVGLPLLIGLAKHFETVVGFDIDSRRVEALRKGHDWTGETEDAALGATRARITDRAEDLKDCTFFIVTVPTPIDQAKRPDLRPVLGACKTIGEVLKQRKKAGGNKGLVPLVVFESTVYPGLTEELCGREIAYLSGLKQGVDFKLGYSPERINPGDKVNQLETIIKVISAEDEESLDRVEAVYGKIITAGVHRAANIRVAEAAKVIENTQRDLNVALMNEIAIICDRLGIRTHDVLEAAGTKWNFLKFTPGLVGGHCIGVDPYYLTARAEELGYHPQVILAGRRINDGMPVFIAQKIVKLLINGGHLRESARVGILGLAFKENVRDLRNSRVPDIVRELHSFGIEVLVHDPVADPAHARHEYGIELCDKEALSKLDAIVLAVPHRALMDDLASYWPKLLPDGYVIDVKSVLDRDKLPRGLRYWSL
ncbi:MAG: nucleotide sugar dehydrogenase [Alphaproteobacteria bacterium]|nr:nucleotide sugar dehydrogenase [Alphaproteobacteria bacterium]